eukprot:776492-Pelagomonas_calceolata.AAC.2
MTPQEEANATPSLCQEALHASITALEAVNHPDLKSCDRDHCASSPFARAHSLYLMKWAAHAMC